ncbi:SGNH/GDSL hydrolase family protein [Mycolicibacterium lacusdiani]|jgi:lysophospholipase L1-like esterase|uniref:SGNH/GDSL hydrolase family protein n=1 Tax=Mycolicibacterium lacusdiani TaxID=2895283 RepID=UPI001F1E5C25|nr:SGNH/GDSL hydrolase family protein [Mycolicibacterium lacusdiani]
MNGVRLSDIASAATAAAVAIGLVLALTPDKTPSAPPQPADTLSLRLPQAEHEPPTALFIGDSYTAGPGPRELSPSCLAASRLGWLCHLSAVPGTGYVSGGPSNRFTVDDYRGESTSFSERIPLLANQFDPDIVILDGGRNDQFPPRANVLAAMVATIADARRAWPEAEIVFERPRFLSRPNDDLGFDESFTNRLLRDPDARGVSVIDPIRAIDGRDTSNLLSDDGIHPNRQGELDLAAAITASLVDQRFAADA